MLYRLGSKDKQVGIIQSHLNRIREEVSRAKDSKYKVSNDWTHLDIDNDFGPLTEKAVRGFQKMMEITENGIVGNTTWNYLSTFSLSPTISATPVFSGAYKIGCRGPEVKEIQQMLNKAWEAESADTRSQYNWEYIAVDGVFGERTEAAVFAFQKYTSEKYGEIALADGIVGSRTLEYLRNNQQLCRADRYLTEFNRRIDSSLKNVSKLITVDLKNFMINRIADLIKKNGSISQYINETKVEFNKLFGSYFDENKAFDFYDDIRNKPKFNRNCDRYVTNTLNNYFSSKGLANRIKSLADKETKSTKCANSNKIGGAIGFVISFREPIYLLFHQEDTKQWREKFKKEAYESFDNFLLGMAAAALAHVIIFAVVSSVLGPEAAPVGGLIGFIIFLVELLLGALIAWLFACIYKLISGFFMETRPLSQLLLDNLKSTFNFNYKHGIEVSTIPYSRN